MLEAALSDYLDGSDIVAEIVMLRAAATKSVIILEGETDRKLLSFFINENLCDIVVGHGRAKVLWAISDIRRKHIVGVVSLIDADYDEFLGIDLSADDVLITEEHDIETILVKSSAFAKVLSEFGSTQKIKSLVDSGRSVRDLIFEIALDLGLLRLHSRQNGDYLKFNGFKFRSLDKRRFSWVWNDVLKEVLNHSSKPHLPTGPITAAVTALKAGSPNKFRLCCGHDLTELTGIALQACIGSQSALTTSRENIETHLRLGFSWEDFKVTKLYRDICLWEQKNTPFAIF